MKEYPQQSKDLEQRFGPLLTTDRQHVVLAVAPQEIAKRKLPDTNATKL
jgi:hypothetical protein